MHVVQVSGGPSGPYPVYIGSGLLPQLGGFYRRHGLRGRALLVSDETVMARHGEAALGSLRASDVDALAVAVPAGEAAKSLDSADRLYEHLIQHGLDRQAVVVALGGGVVGDLAGFVAATYLRGVALVHVPTTLLSQVDSAIGGKTGVNHRLGKNLVGAFHAPSLVVADLDALDTLPEREWASGLGEVIKYGLIADRELFEQLERCPDGALRRGGAPRGGALEALVARCVQIKADVVAADGREAGVRRTLNFGHTLGHALESLSDYRHFRHGEAVLWGMLGEAYLSFRHGGLREMEFVRVQRLLARVPKPALPAVSPEAFLAHVRRDKKSRGGQIHLAWLHHLGACRVAPVAPERLLEALAFCQRVSEGK